MDKKQLRDQMRQARSASIASLAPGVRMGLNQALAQQVLPHIARGACVGSYAALGDEVDPKPLEALLRAQGCQIGLPVIAQRMPAQALDFWPYAPEDALEVGPFGILQPPPRGAKLVVDTLLVPLLATTRNGTRLGQGGGYYDRTLEKLRQTQPLKAIGLAWSCQLVEQLPHEPWDQPLDYIATPSAWIACRT
jgi:5-formyltetrahydrofolate cyclo-ligase